MNSSTSVLLCDKDVYALMALKEQLSELGFVIYSATSKKDALYFLDKNKVDIVLSELNLEDSDAIVLCQEIRSKKEIHQPYVLIYSEKNEDYIQITSFNSGADDFLIKPLKAVILASRFNALLRRQKKEIVEKKHPRKDLYVDVESYKVIKNGKALSLPRKEFEMLSLLYSNPHKVFTRQEIAIELWNDEAVAKQRTIDIHVRNIRKKVGQEVIKTLKGIGYCLA